MTPEKERREAAALTIQQQWRKRHAIRRQKKFQEATEQGILDIQSALRGHLIRKRVLLSQPPHLDTTRSLHSSEVEAVSLDTDSDVSDSESSETCVAVERIQAALRGHMARQMALHDRERYACVCVCVYVHVHVLCMTLYILSVRAFSSFTPTAKAWFTPSHAFPGWQECSACIWQKRSKGM